MGNLVIKFIGVQAYAPVVNGAGKDERLEVYMPNGTRLGTSPKASRPMHMPAIWRIGRSRWNPINIDSHRFFPWCTAKLVFPGKENESKEGSLDLASLHQRGGSMNGRLSLSKDRMSDPMSLSGVVMLDRGIATARGGGDGVCKFVGWRTEAGKPLSPPPISNISSVIREVEVVVEDVDEVRVEFTSLLNPAARVPTPISIPRASIDHALVIGNVCAETYLRWPRTDAEEFLDQDFAWLYELVGDNGLRKERPVPVLKRRMTAVMDDDPPHEILKEFRFGGGGGVGCECQAAVVRKEE